MMKYGLICLKEELPEKIENCEVYGILYSSDKNEQIIE